MGNRFFAEPVVFPFSPSVVVCLRDRGFASEGKGSVLTWTIGVTVVNVVLRLRYERLLFRRL